jgi:hypothetical protein
LKKREPKSVQKDAVGRAAGARAGRTLTPSEDRLSGLLAGQKRLSAANRSTLARAGARWLSFARGLSHSRRRNLAISDTLGFIESLYGGRFKAIEGDASPLDKVYRMAGGGLFVSETRLSVSVHPRFDLRLLNVAHIHAGAQVFEGATNTTTALTLLSRAGTSEREQTRAALPGTHGAFDASSLTIQALHVSAAGGANLPNAFGYVSARGPRARQAQRLERAQATARDARQLRGDVTTSPRAETSRLIVEPSPASLRLSRHGLLSPVMSTPRQEFASVILKKHLPLVVSSEVLNERTTVELPGASSRQIAVEGGVAKQSAPAQGTTLLRQAPARAFAEPATRRALGGVVEVRREFHITETLRARTATRGFVVERAGNLFDAARCWRQHGPRCLPRERTRPGAVAPTHTHAHVFIEHARRRRGRSYDAFNRTNKSAAAAGCARSVLVVSNVRRARPLVCQQRRARGRFVCLDA